MEPMRLPKHCPPVQLSGAEEKWGQVVERYSVIRQVLA